MGRSNTDAFIPLTRHCEPKGRGNPDMLRLLRPPDQVRGPRNDKLSLEFVLDQWLNDQDARNDHKREEPRQASSQRLRLLAGAAPGMRTCDSKARYTSQYRFKSGPGA
jgi:hypothetical protein